MRRLALVNSVSFDRLFDAAGELGRVTGLVNNAGITGPGGRLVDVAPEELLRVFEVDVIGVLPGRARDGRGWRRRRDRERLVHRGLDRRA